MPTATTGEARIAIDLCRWRCTTSLATSAGWVSGVQNATYANGLTARRLPSSAPSSRGTTGCIGHRRRISDRSQLERPDPVGELIGQARRDFGC